jgi:hypothetical protein
MCCSLTKASVQRNLFHLLGWLDPQLFRRVAAMLYGGSSEAMPEPYKDAGREHWRKVVVSSHFPHMWRQLKVSIEDILMVPCGCSTLLEVRSIPA